MEVQHILSPSQVLNVHRRRVAAHRGEGKPCCEKTEDTVQQHKNRVPQQQDSSKPYPSHKSLQNTAARTNHETIMFLDCYMNAKSPDKPVSPSWEILRSITERRGGMYD